jgi:hypothetical protein
LARLGREYRKLLERTGPIYSSTVEKRSAPAFGDGLS